MSPPPSERGRFDPFAALGLERRFDLDPAAVRSAYRARASGLHPDRAVDPTDRESLVRASAELAEAQRVLLDPVRRGEALIEAFGGPIAAGPPAGEFLVEMMELRESIDGASGDAAALAAMLREIGDRLDLTRDRLATALAGLADVSHEGRTGLLRIAAGALGELRSLDRLRRAAEDAAGPPPDDGDRR